MARRSSKNGDKTKNEAETSSEAIDAQDSVNAENPETQKVEDAVVSEPAEAEVAMAGDDTLSAEEPALEPSDDAIEGDGTPSPEVEAEMEPQTELVGDAENAAQETESETVGDDKVDTAEDAIEADPEPTPEPISEPAPPPQTVVEKRGPGFVPLVLGGVLAAGLGYFASVGGLLPGGDTGPSPEIEAALSQQAETLAALQEQLANMGSAEAPSVDLSPVTDEIAGLSAQLDEAASAIATLTDRVVTLEERPIFSGDVTADTAEAAETIAAMEEQMLQREQEAAERAAEAEAAAQAAADAAAAAQAEAEAAMAMAQAEAAINALRLAVTRGQPFEEPLGAVAAVVDVPEALSASAADGIPSLEALQDAFPAAARAALPVALRETAGDSPVDRFTAFVQGQVAGRAVEPREGDSVDAILSRAQGAVTSGDLAAALAEIAALPEGAQAELAGWTSGAQARRDAQAALDTITQALSGAN